MSKIVLKLPQDQEPLRWWRMRLERNKGGHIMVQAFDDADNPTEGIWEFFDGHDVTLENPVQVVMDRRHLHVLSRGQPTPSQKWIPGDPIQLPDPDWVPRHFPDIY